MSTLFPCSRRGSNTAATAGTVLAGLVVGGLGADCRAQTCQPFWTAPGRVPRNPSVVNIVVYNDGTGSALYAGSSFDTDPNGYAPDPVRRWDGASWSPVGPGQLAGRSDVDVWDDGSGPRLYSIGYTYPQNEMWCKIWNGLLWEPAPPGMLVSHAPNEAGDVWPRFSGFDGTGHAIYGIMSVQPAGFQNAICRWSGAGWTILGQPNMGSPSQFAFYDFGLGPQLFAAPTYIGEVARWSGQTWVSIGPGESGLGRAMCVFDDGSGPALYVGGDQATTGIGTQCIARWNGQAWSSVGGGVSGAPNSVVQVNALTVFDDGSGPALVAAGAFTAAGGVPVRNIAKWNGTSWSPLGAGIGFQVISFATFDDPRGHSLFASGSFQTVGGGRSPTVAQWVGCLNCYANCDNSTQSPRLNVLDFLCFLNKFAARDPYANCTVDSTIDITDFVCFLNKFAAGCP